MSVVVDTNLPALPPDPTTIVNQSIGKRKRSPEVAHQVINDDVLRDDAEKREKEKESFDNLLLDVLKLLVPVDTDPSILNCPITSCVHEDRASKRPKLVSPEAAPLNTPPSITSLVAAHAYQSIEEFYKDVTTAIASASLAAGDSREPQTLVFQQELSKALRLIVDQDSKLLVRPTEEVSPAIKDEESKASGTSPETEAPREVALTIFGGTNNSTVGARELFSSLRHSRGSQTQPTARSSTLPNFISLTEVKPAQSVKTKESGSKPPAFGQVFTPARHLKPLELPKQSSQTTTRGQSVSWYNHSTQMAPPIRLSNRDSYYDQTLRTGRWLSYNASPDPSELTSADEKRMQRDRALSTGEANAELTEEEQESIRLSQAKRQQAKNDALFKSAYSNFAPSYDNENAVVPLQLKSRVWWSKFGQDRYQKFKEALDSADSRDINGALNDIDEDQLFKDAVDSFQEDLKPPVELQSKSYLESNKDLANREVDEILDDITDLLRTLNSYQRNRNLSLATQTQTSAGQNKGLTELSGDPSNPSTAEIDLYEMLKNQLSILISTLPPYAVAKLDGEQLSNLNITTKIRVEAPNYPGQMPNADSARPAQAMNVVPNSVARPQSGVSSKSNGYPQAAATPHNRGTYGTTHPTPLTNYAIASRPPASHIHYPTQQAPLTRNYPHYPPQTPTTQGIQYANGNRQFPTQNGYPNYPQQYNPPATSPNVARPNQYLQRPTQPLYQQRAQASQVYSNYGMPTTNRAGSPQNPAASYLGPTQRMSYPGGAAATSPQRANAAAMSSNNGNNAITSILSRMTPEEQVELMRRQRVHMAQNSTRIQPDSSGTPQTQVAGGMPQTNGAPATPTPAPAPQQNGEGITQEG